MMDTPEVGLHVSARAFRCDQQQPLQRDLVAGLHGRPGEARRGGQPDVLGDDTLGNAQRCRDPFVGQLGVELEP